MRMVVVWSCALALVGCSTTASGGGERPACTEADCIIQCDLRAEGGSRRLEHWQESVQLLDVTCVDESVSIGLADNGVSGGHTAEQYIRCECTVNQTVYRLYPGIPQCQVYSATRECLWDGSESVGCAATDECVPVCEEIVERIEASIDGVTSIEWSSCGCEYDEQLGYVACQSTLEAVR